MTLDDTARERLADVRDLEPTTNGELRDRWGMDSGKDVARYLRDELAGQVYRDDDSKIRAESPDGPEGAATVDTEGESTGTAASQEGSTGEKDLSPSEVEGTATASTPASGTTEDDVTVYRPSEQGGAEDYTDGVGMGDDADVDSDDPTMGSGNPPHVAEDGDSSLPAHYDLPCGHEWVDMTSVPSELVDVYEGERVTVIKCDTCGESRPYWLDLDPDDPTPVLPDDADPVADAEVELPCGHKSINPNDVPESVIRDGKTNVTCETCGGAWGISGLS